MDKMTQALLQSKANSVKDDVTKNMSTLLIGEDEKSQEKRRQNSLKGLEESRERARLEREKNAQLREDEREQMRTNMREKYKLKGSKGYDGKKSTSLAVDSKFSENAENMTNKKDCSIQ